MAGHGREGPDRDPAWSEKTLAVSIEIQHVKKQYDDNVVIRDLSALIRSGELFTLLGPSGCGKTTLLRMIAGFNSIEAGTISFDGRVVNDIPVYKRNFGMVFQNYAIFPNMTVYRNIEYGLKNKKLSRPEIARRVESIMETVRIAPYRDRYPEKLSGGQQQRVALARAIVVKPQVLLMDEPLSNLDAKLRLEMREAIREIQKDIGITTIYVTHDQEEALAISDRIGVMSRGDILQVDEPERIYQRPHSTFVADFIGHSNHFAGRVTEWQGGKTGIALDNGHPIVVPVLKQLRKGDAVHVYVRPEEFVFTSPEQGMKGRVLVKLFLGRYINYRIDLGGGEPAEVTVDATTVERIHSAGDDVYLTVNVQRANVFHPETGVTLMEGVLSNAS